MKTPPTNKIYPTFWLAIVLAIVATSCTGPNANRSIGAGSSEPVKGATLLLHHSR